MDVNKSFNDWLNSVQLQYNTEINNLTNEVLNLTSINSGLTQQVLQLNIINTGLTAQVNDLNKQIEVLKNPPKFKIPYGVNIHPTNVEYADSKKVFDLVRNLGMDSVRMDMHSNAQGIQKNEAKFLNEIIPASTGIRLFGMLTQQGLDVTSTDAAGQYKVGFGVGNGYGSAYGKYFEAIELGNELDNLCILSGKDGTQLSHFDSNKIKMVGNYCKGMMDGLKAAVPNIKIIMDVCWTHFAFITEMINTYGIKIDVLASHWYWSMEKAKPNYIEAAITALFPNIPIIFNETGYDVVGGAQEDCLPMITRMKKSGVFVYELLDEYVSRTAGSKEGSFGLFDKNLNPKTLATLLIKK